MTVSPLDALALLDTRKSRCISSENPDGAPGGGGRHEDPNHGPSRELGRGWKVRPCQGIDPGEVFTIADISGPGLIESIWCTPRGVANRDMILRVYWDGQDHPSIECPLGDFFASAYTSFSAYAPINSPVVCVNPANALNCYWPMPFRKHCRMTLENRSPDQRLTLFYQVNYSLGEVPEDSAYFHAQFRRTNPTEPRRVATVVDGIRGRGRYVGTYMAWQTNSNGWWGEGEVKFYLDGDLPEGESVDSAVAEHGGDRFPTICTTGTEDYFCGSYNFEDKTQGQYREFTTAYAGMPHVVRPDGLYRSQMCFSLYRWHLPDPIRFDERLAVTVQALGLRPDRRYLPLRDDIASVAYWYQTLPSAPFPALGDRETLEIT